MWKNVNWIDCVIVCCEHWVSELQVVGNGLSSPMRVRTNCYPFYPFYIAYVSTAEYKCPPKAEATCCGVVSHEEMGCPSEVLQMGNTITLDVHAWQPRQISE